MSSARPTDITSVLHRSLIRVLYSSNRFKRTILFLLFFANTATYFKATAPLLLLLYVTNLFLYLCKRKNRRNSNRNYCMVWAFRVSLCVAKQTSLIPALYWLAVASAIKVVHSLLSKPGAFA